MTEKLKKAAGGVKSAAKDHPKTTLGAALALAGMVFALYHAGWDPSAIDAEKFLTLFAIVVVGVFGGDAKGPAVALLLCLPLAGCASTSDADLRALADQQRLERRVETLEADLTASQAALASHDQALQQQQRALSNVRQVAAQAGLQGAAGPLRAMDERFGLVGARLDHAEDGLERGGWARDPELAAQVEAIKAAAAAEAE